MDIWLIHGLVGAIAIFVIYPLGIIIRRLPSSRISHTTTQSIGIAFTSIGAAIGIWKSVAISTPHQFLGLAMMLVVCCQFCIGLMLRELDSSSIAKRYLRWIHAIQGFGSLALGWYCFISGLLLASWGTKVVVTLGLTTMVEVVAVPTVHMLVLVKARYTPVVDGSEMSMPAGEDDDCIGKTLTESRDALCAI